MSNSIAASVPGRHHLLPETSRSLASAVLRKAEKRDWPAEVGEAIKRARLLVGWSLKEFAAELEKATQKKRDETQIGRWEKGQETPQLAALFAVEQLRGPLVVQLANLAHEIEVITEIRVRS